MLERRLLTDAEIDALLAADEGYCEIPAPRSGKHYDLFIAEAQGCHGCLDSPAD